MVNRRRWEYFRWAVLQLCLKYSASETSGLRTEAHNRAVSGRADSYHLEKRGALGCDVTLDNMAVADRMMAEAREVWHLQAEAGKNHVHLELDEANWEDVPMGFAAFNKAWVAFAVPLGMALASYVGLQITTPDPETAAAVESWVTILTPFLTAFGVYRVPNRG